MIPLDQLRFGHEADPPINARRVGRDDDVEQLAESIMAHGLIQPLAVRTIGDIAYVADGNRRLAAIRRVNTSDGLFADGVPCIEQPDTADAEEISLAANIMRTALHEADQYETFHNLADRGLGVDRIAGRFGIEPARVKRILALGRLSPLILDWWRDQDPGRNTIETVRAFTLAPSIDEQERVFRALEKAGRLYDHHVRHEFGAGDRQIGKMLDLVGMKAYTAAGGSVVEDLFGDDHAVSDPALVKKLVAEKLQAKVDEALKEGWSWAALADDLPQHWSWNWHKLPTNKKKATKEQKAQSGVVVGRDYSGKLQITYGVVKPEAAKKEKGAAGAKAEKVSTISNAMMHRLSIQVTQAAQKALTEEPRIGLVALLAGFWTRSDGPVRVHTTGMGGGYSDRVPFASAFASLSAMSDADLFRVAAGIAGQALDMQSQNALRAPLTKGAEVLAAAIDPDRMSAALRESWDAVDYFNGVAKPFVIQAIREAVNEDEARKAEKLKKKELVEFAVKNVQGTGWLPPELRCATYSGPGEIPQAAPAPADEDDDTEGGELHDDDIAADEDNLEDEAA